MNYGHFSKDGKEYIITNVNTPSPWINYLYNDNYFASISNNGGGISYFKSPLHGRITRYRINDVPNDRPGKYIYIKDNDTGEIWSLTWQPVGNKVEAYQVIHGFGYTLASSEIDQIASSVLFFVPQHDDQEIWKTTLTNKSNKKRNLSLFGYVEFALGHALVDLINQCDDQHFNRVYFDKELNSIFATKTYWVTETRGTQHQENKEWDQWAFFTANLPIVKYETLRERFIGLYRNENNPIGIESGNLSCKDTDFGNAIGAIQIDLSLEPGEMKEVILSLGVISKNDFDFIKEQSIRKYHNMKNVEVAFKEVEENWKDFLKYTKVETPDNEVNIFLNYWTQYQAKVAFDVGRVASFYYWGIGRGFGYRDTAQDTIAITISNPNKARERILLLARQMQRSGKVYHHFYDDGQGEFTQHCDDPLWFILAVTSYVRETGDLEFLNESENFLDGKKGTILEHLYAVVNFAKTNLAIHGLPIFGRGDWNDTLDYIGGKDGGESVWGGMFYTAMLNRLIDLLKHIKNTEKIKEVELVRDKIRSAVEEYCWDGEWYIRAFGENQKKIGSKDNKYGKIFINTQSWAVIGKISDKERLIKAMDSARKYLDSEFGPKICLITRCVWGKKENGAVFCHPVTWLIQAECLLRRGNEAFDYYKKLLPDRVDSDIFIAEPYVYSQYITSDEHDSPGRASHSWQTGTAAWMYKICFDFIIGVRSTYQGLQIDPVIPSSWKSFKCERIFRGTVYKVTVENPNGLQSGIESIIVDGKKIEGNILPISADEICNVYVKMG
jgi:cellobiose phosphorylase